MRRHPDDRFARRQQRLLKPARTRAAVLDRPYRLACRSVRLSTAVCGYLVSRSVDEVETIREEGSVLGYALVGEGCESRGCKAASEQMMVV